MSVNNQIVIIGSYNDLIVRQGLPNESFISKIGITDYEYLEDTDSITNRKFRKIDVTYLLYGDSLHYIKIGDSVQLTHINFLQSDIVVDYKGIVLQRKYNFKNAIIDFALRKPRFNYCSIERVGDDYIKTYAFGLHTKDKEPFDDNLWFVFFHKNKKLWYIDFPLKCDGSIVK